MNVPQSQYMNNYEVANLFLTSSLVEPNPFCSYNIDNWIII